MLKVGIGVLALLALIPLRMVLIKFGQSAQPPLFEAWIANAIVGSLGIGIISITLFSLLRGKKETKSTDPAQPSGASAGGKTIEPVADTRGTAKGTAPIKLPEIHPGSLKIPKSTSGPKRFKKICLVCNREFPEDFVGKCPQDKVELSRIADKFAPGSKFSEYYEIASPLGTGGLSRVYLAKHISSGRDVAIKLLHAHLCADKPSVQRFQREANALRKLSHPNLVSVEDFMISPDGIPFIVMEYLEGESLHDVLKREGGLRWQNAVNLFLQICKGLSHAHSQGIIHRDLKPGNIMLVPQGGTVVAKVVDFGLVKANNDVDSLGRITETGEVFGSPMYMSPEQCQGRPVDRRSDVYSLGCLLYECLCGKPPYIGKNVIETLTLQLKAPIPELPPQLDVPPWLVETVHKAMQKDPEQRFQSIEDLGGALQDGLSFSRK